MAATADCWPTCTWPAGTYEKESRISWADFHQPYQEHCQARRRPSTVDVDRTAFDHFERIIRPGRLSAITTATIERYVDIRVQERVQGGRTERVPLLPIVVQHLQPIRILSPMVFPRKHSERLLYPELERIAEAAEVKFPSNGRREDKFHFFRKSFGTRAALAGIDRKALTALMRHQDYSTTESDAEALMAQAVGQIEVAVPVREVVG